MNYAVIDIGSNSVRLMISDGVKTISKNIQVTKLALGMGEDLLLKSEAVERTVRAVSFFVNFSKQQNIKKIFIFATAAVRKAKNKQMFLDRVYNQTGLVVDVISGEKESLLGGLGVLKGKDGAIIDVGGASSEIAVFKYNKPIYAKSLDCGVVSLTDKFAQNKDFCQNYMVDFVKNYGEVPKSKFYGIGGTATSIAAMLLDLPVYDANLVNGFEIKYNSLCELTNKLYSLSIEGRKKLNGLQPQRAEVISSGCVILKSIMEYLKIDCITVSEDDNLEGYLIEKLVKYE